MADSPPLTQQQIGQRHAMSAALEEIRRLRLEAVRLRAIADTVAIFGAITLGSRPASGMAEDAAWLLERELDKLENPEQSEIDQ
jgi:hypothetical protein